jgi:hypothetical protein
MIVKYYEMYGLSLWNFKVVGVQQHLQEIVSFD